MSNRLRTPRGTGIERTQINFLVSVESKAKLNGAADALSLSQSQVMKLLLEEIAVVGEKVFVGGVEIVTSDSQEALPLKSTA